jgi:hypothetical protein
MRTSGFVKWAGSEGNAGRFAVYTHLPQNSASQLASRFWRVALTCYSPPIERVLRLFLALFCVLGLNWALCLSPKGVGCPEMSFSVLKMLILFVRSRFRTIAVYALFFGS